MRLGSKNIGTHVCVHHSSGGEYVIYIVVIQSTVERFLVVLALDAVAVGVGGRKEGEVEVGKVVATGRREKSKLLR